MPSATDVVRRRRRRAATAALAGVALVGGLLTACTPDFLLDGGGSGGAPVEQDCIAEGYPCSWSEADDGALERSGTLLQVALAFAESGRSAAEIADSLAAAPDVRDIRWDEYGLQFRVEGGLPVTLDLDPDPRTDDPLLSGGGDVPARSELPSLRDALPAPFTTCDASSDVADGFPGVVGTPGDGSDALLLSPWQFQLDWDLDAIFAGLDAPGSQFTTDYGGTIALRETVARGASIGERSVDNVSLADLCGWEAFDVIILMTHGRALCAEVADSGSRRCLTSFSLGIYSETLTELETLLGGADGVTFGVSEYSGFRDDLTPDEKAVCDRLVEEIVAPEGFAEQCAGRRDEPVIKVSVTSDFFLTNYPNGLADRLIFLAACQGMKFRDMADALGRDGSGKILGFDQVVYRSQATALLKMFTERLGKAERIDQGFLDEANAHLDSVGAKPDLQDAPLGEGDGDSDVQGSGATPTWGADLVSLRSAGTELVDGATVDLVEPAPAPGADALQLTLRLSDVTDRETPADFDVRLLWNDTELDLPQLRWEPGERTAWTADVAAVLPRELDEGERFDLEIRASLPAADGAPTWWRYEDLTAGAPDPCSRLSDAEVQSALGLPLVATDEGSGFGDFFGGLCGWQTPEGSANESSLQILVEAGGAAAFRESADGSPDLVDGFGDVALYEPTLGRGDDCPLSTGPGGESHWACFVNLTVALGPDTLHVVLDGDVVGESGPDGSLDILRAVIAAMRS